jgi:hypothetical protein
VQNSEVLCRSVRSPAFSGTSEFLFNHLNDVETRFYGETAVAQGKEGWKKKDGTTGKFVWTDTWIRQGGKWRVVAAEDLVPPPAAASVP